MSMFGKPQKMYKQLIVPLSCIYYQICKKLSGDGKGTAEWCTNVANERGQILISVLTCEESLTKLRPMAEGLMARYKRAGEAPPELMYVDRGCCRVLGVSSLEQLFSGWADEGMLIRLDIFHWIHRFDAAIRTNHHPPAEAPGVHPGSTGAEHVHHQKTCHPQWCAAPILHHGQREQ